MISEFKGQHRFLSNFYPVQVTVGGITYPTSEHAFQAQKARSAGERRAMATLASPVLAKQRGRELEIPENWDSIRKRIMLNVVIFKFVQNPHLARLLEETGARVLTEGNAWHDSFWGVCRDPGPHPPQCAGTGQGANYLGQILMAVRMVLKPD